MNFSVGFMQGLELFAPFHRFLPLSKFTVGLLDHFGGIIGDLHVGNAWIGHEILTDKVNVAAGACCDLEDVWSLDLVGFDGRWWIRNDNICIFVRVVVVVVDSICSCWSF